MSDEQQIFGDSGERAQHLAQIRDSDSALGRSLALVRFLRMGCPWDAKQTPSTLRPYLLEEAHEVAEAIRNEDDEELASELGDLLLNIAFQVVLAEERDSFGPEDVVAGLEKKMRDRHPHLYGEADEAPDWEELKAELKAASATDPARAADPFDGVPTGLEPLSRSLRLQDRAAARNFDWPDVNGALGKLHEEIGELERELSLLSGAGTADAALEDRLEDEIGDLLFAAVNVARLAGIHPSTALERAAGKFSDRFRSLLTLARERGIDPDNSDLETLDLLSEEVKESAAG
jgi:MazG family protein